MDYSRELNAVQKIERRLTSGPPRPRWQRAILAVCHPFWTCAAIGAGVGLSIGYVACVRYADQIEIVWHRLGYFVFALFLVSLSPETAHAQSASATVNITVYRGGGGVRWGHFSRGGPGYDARGNVVDMRQKPNEGWSPEIKEGVKRGNMRAEMCGSLATWADQRVCLRQE